MARIQTRRLSSILVLVGVGVAGLVVPVRGVLQDSPTTPLEFSQVLVALLFVLPVWYIAYWTSQNVSDTVDTHIITGWCLGLTVVAALITAAAVYAQARNGVYLHEPLTLVNNVGLTGTMIGSVVGYFHTNTRQQAREAAVARDRLAEQKQHLVFLNRLLRHDIRNDVNVIHGYAELLADRYPNEPRLETIRRKSEEIDDLTNLARDISTTATDSQTDEIRLAPTLEQAASQVRDSFPDATVVLADDLSESLTVRADKMLSAVFQNLLRNAIQHNEGPSPAVTVQTESDADTVRVRVTDNGPGIPESIKQNLFQAGQKGDDSAGTGLGLYLVETLVRSYGGDVWVTDADAGGTTVTVELQRAS